MHQGGDNPSTIDGGKGSKMTSFDARGANKQNNMNEAETERTSWHKEICQRELTEEEKTLFHLNNKN